MQWQQAAGPATEEYHLGKVTEPPSVPGLRSHFLICRALAYWSLGRSVLQHVD
jgi:hypothetical protein